MCIHIHILYIYIHMMIGPPAEEITQQFVPRLPAT